MKVKTLAFIGAGLVALAILAQPVVFFATKTEVAGVTVTGKERVTTNSANSQMTSKYLVFTDLEVFENTDSWLALKFNSSDVYGQMINGRVCDFTVTGFRVPFLSMYRNIVKAECR